MHSNVFGHERDNLLVTGARWSAKKPAGRPIETVAVPAARASCRPHGDDDMTVPMMPQLCLCFACNMAAEKQQSLTHERETTIKSIVASIRSMHACNRPRPDGGRRGASRTPGEGDGDEYCRAVASGQMRGAARDRAGKGKESSRAAGPRGNG